MIGYNRLKNLKGLIETYEAFFRSSYYEGDEDIIEMRKTLNGNKFVSKLIKIDFNYKLRDIKDLARFLDKKDFSRNIRALILEMVVRKKSMEEIKDPSRKEMLWPVIDAFFYKQEEKSVLLRKYLAKYGYEEVRKDFNTIEETYKNKISPELKALDKNLWSNKQSKDKKWLDKVSLSHLWSFTFWAHPKISVPKKVEEDLEKITRRHKSMEELL